MVTNDGETEYWRWLEYQHIIPDVKWQNAKVITAGVDVGSVGSKAVVMVDGEVLSWSVMRTGSNSSDSANKALGWAMQDTGLALKDFNYIVGTGYGRVNVPMANRAITEIACHAKGANFIWGKTVRTVLDVGGQDVKAIRCDENGKVVSFLMNDKCAAGTGRGMEVIADLLKIPIEDVGKVSLRVKEEPEPVSSTCVVFAKSEAVGLLRKGWPKEKVLAAYCSAMAHRVVTLLMRLGIEEKFAITGGIAKNIGVVKRIEEELKLKAPEPNIDPQLAGAIGAALFAKALVEKQRKKA